MVNVAHYALINEKNIVVNVFVGRDENDLAEGISDWEEYYAIPLHYVKRTSYNTVGGVHYTQDFDEEGNPQGDPYPSEDQSKAFRKNFAGIGFTYDAELDAFIPPQPVDSWILDKETCLWQPMLPPPEDGKQYEWDDTIADWVEVV